MIWLILLVITGIIAYNFFKDFNQDNKDLEHVSVYQKFNTIAQRINDYAYDGKGILRPHINDKRSFHVYLTGAPQIINFDYGAGILTIEWKYKYLGDLEVIHRVNFPNCRNLSESEQIKIADRMIYEMDAIIDDKMIEVHGFNPQKSFTSEFKKNTADKFYNCDLDNHIIEKFDPINKEVSQDPFNDPDTAEELKSTFSEVYAELQEELGRVPNHEDLVRKFIRSYGREEVKGYLAGLEKASELLGKEVTNTSYMFAKE